MENRSHALIAGLFVIILSLSIVAISLWFGGNTTARNHYLVVSNESVTGLNPQAAVDFRGVNIGKVEAIYFDQETTHQILIDISIDENIKLSKNVFARLGYQGVTGLAYLQLNDDGTTSDALESDARIPMHRSLLDQMAGSGQDILSNMNELIKQTHQLLSEQNQTQVSNILMNIEKATSHLDHIFQKSQQSIESFSGFTTETKQVLTHLDQLLLEIHQITIKMNQQGGVIDSLSQTAEAFADTAPKLHKVSDGIIKSTQSMNRTLRQLEEHPQSLLFGRPPQLAGPGEDGFVSPRK